MPHTMIFLPIDVSMSNIVKKSFINGKAWGPATAAKTFDLFNASTAKLRARVEQATPDAIETAIQTAQEAQPKWHRDYSPMDRAKLLLKAAQILEEPDVIRSIAELETEDTGRPLLETMNEAATAADCIQWFAGLARSIGGQHVELSGGSWGYTRREPLGLTVGIGAWNYPLQSAVLKSSPSLAFGNAMVFKPSELTPQTALRLADIYKDAGIPDGVFNVVLGKGDVGRALVQDPRVQMLSFTGSVATGRSIYTRAAQDFKRVVLELGGKSPLIIFSDADLDAAVTGAMMSNWLSSGQVCSNGTRVFVHSNIVDAFTEMLVERTSRLKIGDPMNANTEIGPMVSEEHMKKVEDYIRVGQEEDMARLLYGGKRINGMDGYFLEPAIFSECRDDMRIVQEEIFGMVMCILPFDNEDEVLRRANDSSFGLSAGVFTQDIRRAHWMVAHLDAGTTWINNYNLSPSELPWGGFKRSGIGSENGIAGVESWTRLKSVYVEMNRIETPY